MIKHLSSVTIGVPTFDRPKLLRRALESIVQQDYENLYVVVADNCTPGNEVEKIVNSFKGKIKNLTFIKRDSNLGAVENNLRLRNDATTEYFMWLADDDRISPNYISSLAKILNENPDAVCAAGHYYQVRGDKEVSMRRTSNFSQKTAFRRIFRFLWRSDDAFYYGLHRLKALNDASFPGYSYPNKDNIFHNAYVMMLDILMKGKVLLVKDESVRWYQTTFAEKHYDKPESFIKSFICMVLVRFNYIYICWKKIYRKMGPLPLLPIIPMSIVAQIVEIILIPLGLAPGSTGQSIIKKFLTRKSSKGDWFRDRQI